LTPDGQPANNAYVGIATINPKRRVSQIGNGQILDHGWYQDGTEPFFARTDSSGLFVFPEIDFANERSVFEEEEKGRHYSDPDAASQLMDFIVLVLHDSGTKYLTQPEFELLEGNVIPLEQYARLEGIVKSGTQPLAKERVGVHLESLRVNNFRGPYFMVHHSVHSDNDGKFTIEKVVPSEKSQINRYAGGKNSHYVRDAKFIAGETTFVQVGGAGRPVTGKLQVAEGSGLVPDWDLCVIECAPQFSPNSALVVANQAAQDAILKVITDLSPKEISGVTTKLLINDQFKEERPEDYDKVQQLLKELEEKRREIPNEHLNEFYRERAENQFKVRACPVAADGTFRLDDILPGTWTLKAELRAPRKEGQWGEGDIIGTGTLDFTVPEIAGGVTDEPLELNYELQITND
jgi:hypothetical protein